MESLRQLKNIVNPLEIEPVTLRILTQFLNQQRYRVASFRFIPSALKLRRV
jgi:hypothetical protein